MASSSRIALENYLAGLDLSVPALETVANMCYDIVMNKTGKVVSCGWCNKKVYKKRSHLLSHNNHYCSQVCRISALNHNKVPWNKGTVGVVKPNSGSFKKGERRSVRTEFQPKEHRFKGCIKEYKYIHHAIGKKFGKPDTCELCNKTGLSGRKIHWANITGVYDDNRLNWKRLCVRCHAIIDGRMPNGKLI